MQQVDLIFANELAADRAAGRRYRRPADELGWAGLMSAAASAPLHAQNEREPIGSRSRPESRGQSSAAGSISQTGHCVSLIAAARCACLASPSGQLGGSGATPRQHVGERTKSAVLFITGRVLCRRRRRHPCRGLLSYQRRS
jgi:hypothetical protein